MYIYYDKPIGQNFGSATEITIMLFGTMTEIPYAIYNVLFVYEVYIEIFALSTIKHLEIDFYLGVWNRQGKQFIKLYKRQ